MWQKVAAWLFCVIKSNIKYPTCHMHFHSDRDEELVSDRKFMWPYSELNIHFYIIPT